MSRSERKSFEISETKEYVFQRDDWTCQNPECGRQVTTANAQLAHLIPQSKENLKAYGKEVIHHPDNLMTVCSLRCNNALQVNNPRDQEIIYYSIVQTIECECLQEI